MTYILFFLPLAFCLPILIGNSKLRYYFTLILTVYISILSSIPAFDILINNAQQFSISIFSNEIIIDKLSAFFIIVTNFTMITGMLFPMAISNHTSKTKSR
jgi:hypothetical protein